MSTATMQPVLLYDIGGILFIAGLLNFLYFGFTPRFKKANKYGKERISALFETFGFNVINVTLSEIPVVAEEPTAEVAPSETTTTQN